MGNFTSCCFSLSSSTKVFGADGGVKMVSMPITAAELMLESPGYVVCDVRTLVKTRRVRPLRADDELEMNGGVYMLVQASRINCLLSELEISIIQSACKCNVKNKLRRQCSSKVLPDQVQVQTTTESGHRIRQYWTPALEPIAEVC